jgi:hypothetical protein
LIAGGESSLRLKSDVSFARVKVKGTRLIDPMTATARRLRLAIEGAHEHALSSAGSLTPSLEVGIRHDGGDGLTGSGLEIGGRLKYVNRKLGLTIDGGGRKLVVHRKDYDEWGGDVMVRLDPEADGQGLSLSLAPSYGRVAELWNRDSVDEAATADRSPRQLDFGIGYGYAILSGRGLLTPYGEMMLNDRDDRAYSLGGRLAIGQGLDVNIEGSHQRSAVGEPENGVMLKARLRL